MIDYSISFIIPNKRVAKTTREVLKENNYKYPVYSASQKSALDTAKAIEKMGGRIVISLGITAEQIKCNTNLLVIQMQYSVLELLTAINKAMKISEKIAIIGANNLSYTAGRTLEIIGLQIPIFELNVNETVELQAQRVLDKGYDVIISGTPSVIVAQQQDKWGVMPNIDKRQIISSIQHAQQVYKLLNEADQKYETINTILNSTSEAIIGTDGNDAISFINTTAQKLLKVNAHSVLNKNIHKILQQTKIFNVLDSKHKDNHEKEKWHKVIINSLPVVSSNQKVGFVYTIKEVAQIQNMEQCIRKELLNKGHFAKKTFDDIVGSSELIRITKSVAYKYAQSDGTVLILGETGTGKELFAQSIHNASSRKNEAFVPINCAAIPHNLLESELFGYEKGAFTGANSEGKMGVFEMAHKGTIFLDEISELSMSMQGALLRVLQEKEIRRVGGGSVITIDVRILASSNKSIIEMINEGSFREDLFYRLNILELYLPPLRSRIEDIKLLCDHLIQKKNKESGYQITGMTTELLQLLKQKQWNGNVRELSNYIEKLVLLSDGPILTEEIAMKYITKVDNKTTGNHILSKHKNPTLNLKFREYEKIFTALEQTKGNKKAAADLLGINPSTLWRKLKAYKEGV